MENPMLKMFNDEPEVLRCFQQDWGKTSVKYFKYFFRPLSRLWRYPAFSKRKEGGKVFTSREEKADVWEYFLHNQTEVSVSWEKV